MNHFKESLQKAISCQGESMKVNVSTFDGESYTSEMIFDKTGRSGIYEAEWHNRWCFYRYNRKGRTFLAHVVDGHLIGGNASKVKKEEWQDIKEAVKELLNIQ